MTKTKSGEQYFLKVEPRSIFGKKLKKLRKSALLPANIFGEDFKSTAISIQNREFVKLYKKTGETQVITIELNKEKIPVLIHQVQLHPVNDAILHIDFRKVNLAKKIQTDVPIKIIGQSDVIKSNQGVLLTLADSLKIEALPAEIPSDIEIDISSLGLDDEIMVKDIKIIGKYIVIDEPGKSILRITPHKEESVAPETTTAIPEVEGEKPTEGEEAVAEETKETKTSAPGEQKPKEEKPTSPKPAPEVKK